MGMHINFIFICAAILNQYYGKPLYNNPCSMPYYVVFSMILYSLRIVRSPANSDLQENSKNISYHEILSNVLEIVQVVTAIRGHTPQLWHKFSIREYRENIESLVTKTENFLNTPKKPKTIAIHQFLCLNPPLIVVIMLIIIPFGYSHSFSYRSDRFPSHCYCTSNCTIHCKLCTTDRIKYYQKGCTTNRIYHQKCSYNQTSKHFQERSKTNQKS